jgi:hypothetical protein
MSKHCDGCLTARRSKLNGRFSLGSRSPGASQVAKFVANHFFVYQDFEGLSVGYPTGNGSQTA